GGLPRPCRARPRAAPQLDASGSAAATSEEAGSPSRADTARLAVNLTMASLSGSTTRIRRWRLRDSGGRLVSAGRLGQSVHRTMEHLRDTEGLDVVAVAKSTRERRKREL